MLQQAFSLESVSKLSVSELEQLVRHHDYLYWDKATPEISDDDYDCLIRLLAEKDPDNPILARVNAPAIASAPSIHHKKPMLSLDKVYSFEELESWLYKTIRTPKEPLLVQPKFDGISVLWNEGILSTRGNGFEGKIVTDKVPLIDLERTKSRIPLSQYKDSSVLGELLIRTDDFQNKYNSIVNANGKTFKNSRNAIAGIMSLKDISSMLEQNARLSLVEYSAFSFHSSAETLKDDWNGILESIEALPYPMDGIVIKLADISYSESLGNTVHHPRGQIAFKFSGVRKTTKLLKVNWSFGKNCLTPVAEFNPIDINGTTIRHATLHNLQCVLNRDIHVGDFVTVERAGDVIPKIIDSSPGESREECIITNCPCCGAELEIDLPELRCVNPECLETRLQILLAAVRNIGIERLGEPSLRKMMTKLHVRTLTDLFNLSQFDIYSLDGFKGISTLNLYNEIQSAKTVLDYQLLSALNIHGIGPHIAKSILHDYSFSELRTLSETELSKISGVGEERASALKKTMDEQSAYLDELLSCVTLISEKKSKDGLQICFTGKMPEKRSWYEQIAINAGYMPVSSVGESTSLLITSEPNHVSAKVSNAKKYHVPIQSLDLWLESVKNFIPKTEKKADEQSDDLFQPNLF